MDHPPADRAILLACPVGSVQDYWLQVRCPRGHSAALPCRLLAREGHGRRTIAEFLMRPWCRQCGSRPSEAVLVDDVRRLASNWSGPPPWLVVLLGDPDVWIRPPPGRPLLMGKNWLSSPRLVP